MSIGENIKKFRIAKNWTQEELAQAVGVSVPMITQLERGTKTPTLLLGKDIAQALNCTLEALLGEQAG